MKAFRSHRVEAAWLIALFTASCSMSSMAAANNNLMKHPVEDEDSWNLHVERRANAIGGGLAAASPLSSLPLLTDEEPNLDEENNNDNEPARHRFLKQREHYPQHKEKAHKPLQYLGRTAFPHGGDIHAYEKQQEDVFVQHQQQEQLQQAQDQANAKKQFNERLSELYDDSGIDAETVHGLMIDAGSTGSRMHIYEWEPRILRNEKDVQDAVAGNKLSFPGTDSRWTERLRPGLASFGTIKDDDELEQAVADYLAPLLDFAKTVLHTKQASFDEYPVFLRATAGMRILDTPNRARVISAVRNLFANKTYCPFSFDPEQARVLSGEEEAIYDWANVNFLMGDLIEQSEGAGTVINPRRTHGALDLGGGSTQISFYESKEDVMSNLFKLQIGQGKHWNVYAHSFLYYGMNEALNRFRARLSANKSSQERLVQGVYNPCLPGKMRVDFRSDIHLVESTETSTAARMETWNYTQVYPSGDGTYQAILKNDNDSGNAEECLELAKDLLHLEQNQWCNFDHKGECSFAGVYQPKLPHQSESFGEFVAFSNYYHVWKFLKLPERATIAQLENATRHACSLSWDEFVDYAPNKFRQDDELDSYCFRSAYVYQLLRNGFGFQNDHVIRSVRVISGMKVGWALGAMLYEINALPWSHEQQQPQGRGSNTRMHSDDDGNDRSGMDFPMSFLVGTLVSMLVLLLAVFAQRQRRNKMYYDQYEPIKDVTAVTTVHV